MFLVRTTFGGTKGFFVTAAVTTPGLCVEMTPGEGVTEPSDVLLLVLLMLTEKVLLGELLELLRPPLTG